MHTRSDSLGPDGHQRGNMPCARISTRREWLIHRSRAENLNVIFHDNAMIAIIALLDAMADAL